jgi:hypothetical protein
MADDPDIARTLRSVCVFCGSSPGRDPRHVESARRVGATLAAAGLEVVYGGGGGGMMRAVADGALEAGGRVTGVIPSAIMQLERAHPGLSAMHVVQTMHQRKQMMADLADAFVMLPGGFGTFEEFFEVVTWSQLGMHRKPCVLVDLHGYFGPLLQAIEHAAAAGFVSAAHRAIIDAVMTPEALVPALLGYRAPDGPRWITEAQA